MKRWRYELFKEKYDNYRRFPLLSSVKSQAPQRFYTPYPSWKIVKCWYLTSTLAHTTFMVPLYMCIPSPLAVTNLNYSSFPSSFLIPPIITKLIFGHLTLHKCSFRGPHHWHLFEFQHCLKTESENTGNWLLTANVFPCSLLCIY